MKQLLLFLLCLSVSTAILAQSPTLPTPFFVSGSLNFRKQKSEFSSSRPVTTTPPQEAKTRQIDLNTGFFLERTLAVGIGGSYFENNDPSFISSSSFFETVTQKGWRVGPTVRWFIPLSKSYGFALTSGAFWGKGDGKFTSSSTTLATKSLEANLSPMAYLIFGRWGLELQVGGYQYAKTEMTSTFVSGTTPVTSTQKLTDSGLTFSLQNVRLGLAWYIGGKKKAAETK